MMTQTQLQRLGHLNLENMLHDKYHLEGICGENTNPLHQRLNTELEQYYPPWLYD